MRNKILYIFLDIDGVLNRKLDWQRMFTFNNACLNNFDSLLGYLCNKQKYTVKIILTSTWRTGFCENNTDIFAPLIQILNKYNLQIDGTTPVTTDKSRQQEIDYYIRRNDIHNYIILDDDKMLFDDYSDGQLYFTDCNVGLTEKDVTNIKKITK